MNPDPRWRSKLQFHGLPESRPASAVLLLLVANLLWGSVWVVGKLALHGLTPVQISAWRMIVAGVPVLPWLALRIKRHPLPVKIWPALILLGGLGFVVGKFLNF